MDNFDEFSDVHRGSRWGPTCSYTVTYFVRSGRLLWAATLRRSRGRPEMLKGAVVLASDAGSLRQLVRSEVTKAIDALMAGSDTGRAASR